MSDSSRRSSKPLVIGISSRALLNLEKEDTVYRKKGVQSFIEYQRDHQDELIPKGMAFPLVKSLLELNKRFDGESGAAIKVVIISRNHPDCGVRIMRSLATYGLEIPQAAFTGGQSVVPELKMFNVDLFLSYEENDVIEAVKAGISSAKIFGGPKDLESHAAEAPLLAFDGDSTLFSNEGDLAFAHGGLEEFRQVEFANLGVPLKEGPMYRFVSALAKLQGTGSIENPPFRMALVTARNFQYMQRPIETLRVWGIRLDKAYLIGNMSKKDVLRDLNAVMFFDDNPKHCAAAAEYVPTALVLQPVIVTDQAACHDFPDRERGHRLEVFSGVCRLVLRKDYSKHEQSLLSLYESRITTLSEAEFTAKMGEFQRSAAGTPTGRLLRERQAAGPENTSFYKLKSFLDVLLDDKTQTCPEA
jgi:5'-nucleotidase